MSAAQVLQNAFRSPANRWALACTTLAAVVYRSTTPLVWAAMAELGYLAISIWASKKGPA